MVSACAIAVASLREDRAWSLVIRVRRPVDLARVGWPGVESHDPGMTPGQLGMCWLASGSWPTLDSRQEWLWLSYTPYSGSQA